MVVIVLLGIVSAMIIPEMKGTFGDALLRSTGRELVGVFSLASTRAISLNLAHRVRLEPDSGRYLIEKRTGRGGSRDQFVPATEVLGGQGELDRRIAIEIRKSADAALEQGEQGPEAAGAAREGPEQGRSLDIEFYPDGTAEAAQVLLQDRDGFRLCLRLNPITARVRILDLGRE